MLTIASTKATIMKGVDTSHTRLFLEFASPDKFGGQLQGCKKSGQGQMVSDGVKHKQNPIFTTVRIKHGNNY